MSEVSKMKKLNEILFGQSRRVSDTCEKKSSGIRVRFDDIS